MFVTQVVPLMWLQSRGGSFSLSQVCFQDYCASPERSVWGQEWKREWEIKWMRVENKFLKLLTFNFYWFECCTKQYLFHLIHLFISVCCCYLHYLKREGTTVAFFPPPRLSEGHLKLSKFGLFNQAETRKGALQNHPKGKGKAALSIIPYGGWLTECAITVHF